MPMQNEFGRRKKTAAPAGVHAIIKFKKSSYVQFRDIIEHGMRFALAYRRLPTVPTPALLLRSTRLLAAHPEFFQTQLRASVALLRKEQAMLVLTRRIGETIVVANNVHVTVVSVVGGKVRLGIDAPPAVTVNRAEVRERKLGNVPDRASKENVPSGRPKQA
jgi:carbon storage regulator